MKRTLVFGGSFDPCHRGHLALLTAAARAIRPDEIVIVPAWHALLKGAAPSASPAERVMLIQLGLLKALPRKWRRRAHIDRSELEARRCVPTFETLARLKARRAGAELHFLVGQDSAASFSRWKRPDELKRLATWWYGRRPGSSGAVPSHFRRLPGRFPDMSSTALRSKLALGRPAPELKGAVRERIARRGLYGARLLALLRRSLKPGRFEHTLNVAALAETLAAAHGVDAAKARTAGLLHDLGRRYRPDELARYVVSRRVPAPRRATLLAREPMLLHAYASADIARRELGVSDPDVLSAVRMHTLGGARMSPLDKVVYVADACSADRTHPGVAATRKLAMRDLDGALQRCVADKLAHARAREAWIHPATLSLWKSLRRR